MWPTPADVQRGPDAPREAPTPNPPFSLALPQAIKHDDQQGRLTARDGGVRRQAEGLAALGGSFRQALPKLLVLQRGLMAALAFRCHGAAEHLLGKRPQENALQEGMLRHWLLQWSQGVQACDWRWRRRRHAGQPSPTVSTSMLVPCHCLIMHLITVRRQMSGAEEGER